MNPKTQSCFLLQLLTAFLAGSLLLSACNITPISTMLPTPTMFSETGEASQRPVSPTPVLAAEVAGTEVTFGLLTLVVPPGVASGASGSDSPRFDNEDAAWWQKTPGHQQVMLGDYYILQGKFHQPQIYIYPAQAYAEMVPIAFESIHRLNNTLSNPDAQIAAEQLPVVPFFNAQPVFAANIKTLSFQNGAGVRFLTQYAQSPAPVNNHELFYHFQGLTSDGVYYILAIFPITAPGLAETPAEAAALPLAGIVYPDMAASNADMQTYFTAATNQLNGTPPDAFSPSLNQLDLLIESLKISDSNSGWPAKVSWETAVLILNTGRVTEVVQSHNLDVALTLADGSQITTIEPVLDDIFREVERCGNICSEISLITE